MKIHVTLREDLRKDPEARRRAYERVLRASSLQGVHEKRFERYGIISGELADERALEALRGLAEVASVERDTGKRAPAPAPES